MYGLIPMFDKSDAFWRDFFNAPLANPSAFKLDFIDMKVDIKEDENEFIVDAEIPGVNKEDINVSYNDNVLSIIVEQKEIKDSESEKYKTIKKERSYKKVQRTFCIPDVDVENIKAKYTDGILTLNLPKAKEEKTDKKITIE